MHRNEWRFSFPVAVVREAATARLDYHTVRLSDWGRELDNAEAKLRSQGVTFREMPVTGGARMDAVVDHQLAERVHECRDKRERHLSRIKQFRAVIAGLDQMTDDETLALDLDDIAFLNVYESAATED